MPTTYERLLKSLSRNPKTWLVTGAAGFIGSNLVEALLSLGQRVVGLDNFATGKCENLEDVRKRSGEAWTRCSFIEGDITNPADCAQAVSGVEIVLHQAALGSVPRSVADPVRSHKANVDGFVNMITAARDAQVKRFVYASSSSIYGDSEELPKREAVIGQPISPYALTKAINEQYAMLYARCYGVQSIGLRYFNVFGRRQDPNGDYAAVIPKWAGQILKGEPCTIFGDGGISRDFCYIANVVQANLLAGVVDDPLAVNQAYNVAVGERTTLDELYGCIRAEISRLRPDLKSLDLIYARARAGDIRHSLADIERARALLGYQPTHSLASGLAETIEWYVQKFEA